MSYRDDQAVLEARRDDLQRDLVGAARRAAQLRDAEREQEAIARELAAVEARLARMAARRVPLLEDVRVASPCNASWDAMTGDDQVRFCGQCQKNVYNLSAMAREDAERLIAAREGSICVRLYRRADGTVLSGDCSVGLRKKRVRRAAYGALGAGALAAAAVTMLRTTHCPGPFEGAHVLQGEMAEVPRRSFVEQPAPEAGERGLVLVYWQQIPHGNGAYESWKIYEDHRIVHEAEAGPGMAAKASPEVDDARIAMIIDLAAQVRPFARGILYGYEDSAFSSGFELHGSGDREATPQDAERLADFAAVMLARVDDAR
jgi:hypothetical protein